MPGVDDVRGEAGRGGIDVVVRDVKFAADARTRRFRGFASGDALQIGRASGLARTFADESAVAVDDAAEIGRARLRAEVDVAVGARVDDVRDRVRARRARR